MVDKMIFKKLWYQVFASKLYRRERETHQLFLDKCDEVLKLQCEINRLELPTYIGSWVASQSHAAKQRIVALEHDLAKMSLVRDALKHEKAYSLFLEDSLICHNPGEVFNALPFDKRKEYFERAQ